MKRQQPHYPDNPMTQEKLVAGYRNILATIYSPKQYYARINTFISNFKPQAKNRIKLVDLLATVKSMWSIGIRSRARFLYWRLLAKTSLKNISALPVAIELAIYGLHFEKISNRILSS